MVAGVLREVSRPRTNALPRRRRHRHRRRPHRRHLHPVPTAGRAPRGAGPSASTVRLAPPISARMPPRVSRARRTPTHQREASPANHARASRDCLMSTTILPRSATTVHRAPRGADSPGMHSRAAWNARQACLMATAMGLRRAQHALSARKARRPLRNARRAPMDLLMLTRTRPHRASKRPL